MQKAVFPIQSHADITKAINFMHTHYTKALEEKKPLVVRIDQKQDKRTTAQNRLYHLWMSEIERKTGQDVESLKFTFKKKFLAKIYIRDMQDMAEKYESIRFLKGVLDRMSDDDQEKKKGLIHYENIVTMFILRYVSTTLANTKQFTEYLNRIHDFATIKLNIYLTIPDDLKWCHEG